RGACRSRRFRSSAACARHGTRQLSWESSSGDVGAILSHDEPHGMTTTSASLEAPSLAPAQKWAITLTVMVVAFMQILDTSVTNVILPHLQGSLSAGLDEVSGFITASRAANAVVIPASGWLASMFGRKRFFLLCTTLFVVSSFLSGVAPNLTTLIIARIFQGLGGGPIIPLSQAI